MHALSCRLLQKSIMEVSSENWLTMAVWLPFIISIIVARLFYGLNTSRFWSRNISRIRYSIKRSYSWSRKPSFLCYIHSLVWWCLPIRLIPSYHTLQKHMREHLKTTGLWLSHCVSYLYASEMKGCLTFLCQNVKLYLILEKNFAFSSQYYDKLQFFSFLYPPLQLT